ncbi:MAG: PQQ-binding-like beta-propeller repeat protein [Acidobacteriota bacterium]
MPFSLKKFQILVLAAGWLTLRGHSSQAEPDKRTFEDPAPPKIEKPKSKEPPKPTSYPELRFHQEPKPLSPEATTQEWPFFLGPQHNLVSQETHLLKSWGSSGPPLVWEMTKGTGYASPAVVKDRLVFFHRVGEEERVECLHPETGKRYWQFRYPTVFEDRYGYNNGPRASPVIDGNRVYVYGAEGKLHCLDLATGQLYWKRNLSREFQRRQDFFGVASTPLIEGQRLIINVGAPEGPCVAAFDKLDGRLLWGAGSQWGPSYASPIPAAIHGQRRILVFAGGESQPPSGGLLSIDPESGQVDFQFPWRSRSYESVNASSPVVAGNQVFISASYRTGGALLEFLPDFSHKLIWTTQQLGTHWNTAIHRDGYLYGFDGRNEPDAALVCLDWKTGKEVWRVAPEFQETVESGGQSRPIITGTYRGSLLWADGAFLCLGELGHLVWMDLSPRGYRELARTWLFAARESWSAPVLSRGLLYITQNSRDLIRRDPPRLLCYDLRGTSRSSGDRRAGPKSRGGPK